jgi:hypothetical protein
MKHLREAGRRKRPEGWTNKTWMLHYDNAPAHTSLLISEFLAKYETTAVPQTALLFRFDPCKLFFVPKVEIHSERSLISDDRRKISMGPTRYPANCVPELGKKRWKRCIDSGEEYFEGDKSY